MNDHPQIARFSDLVPVKKTFEVNGIAIPEEAYALVAAKNNVVLMEPRAESSNRAAILGPPSVKVFVSTCPPGQGPALHLHPTSTETFLPLTGAWRISWGRQGENGVDIGPFDAVCVPPGHYRAFRNVGESEATILVMVNYPNEDTSEPTITVRSVRDEVQARFGADVIRAMQAIGIGFE